MPFSVKVEVLDAAVLVMIPFAPLPERSPTVALLPLRSRVGVFDVPNVILPEPSVPELLLLSCTVPLPMESPPLNVFAEPLRIKVPVACLLSTPAPETVPENVRTPVPPFVSMRVSALRAASPCHTTLMLVVLKSSDGVAVWFGLNVSFCPTLP